MANENPKIVIDPNKDSNTQQDVNVTTKQQEDPELDMPYVDDRTIIISQVSNESFYRRVNKASLKRRKEVIGSSVSSCNILSSNKGEIEAYFPALIGESATSADFIKKVKIWLSNILFVVPDTDATLNISFRYNTKRDYLKLKKEEDMIEEVYSRVNRTNLKEVKDALAVKIKALNELEGKKYLYGNPVDLTQYLIYRHCLLYKDVAKDQALINSDPTYRFYIKDAAREKARQEKLIQYRKKAMVNYIEIEASPAKFKAVYIAVLLALNENVSLGLSKSPSEQSSIMMDFVNNYPEKFNKLVSDNHLETKAFIETLIVRGELIRSEFNQQISTADGTPIAANMNEAVAYFDNPNNAAVRTIYQNKLKQF